jgi:hypothetical protein
MSQPELKELGEDIKTNGLRERVKVLSTLKASKSAWVSSTTSPYDPKSHDFELLDGHSRLDGREAAGLIEIFDKDGHLDREIFEIVTLPAGVTPEAYVASLNIHRRHLTAEQKRDAIAKLLKAHPEKGDSLIAGETGSTDKTVAKVRQELEATSEIPELEKTVGRDGKTRRRRGKTGDVSHRDTRTDIKGRRQPTTKMTARAKPVAPPKTLQAEPAVPPKITRGEPATTSAPALALSPVCATGNGTDPTTLAADRKHAYETVESGPATHMAITPPAMLPDRPWELSPELTQTISQLICRAGDDTAAGQAARQFKRFLEARGLGLTDVAVHIARPTKH